ncbi:hypothetical protein M885DRAFT_29021 [Pelagophyceae sp. CCMP2097]|nr:hypothetical protein M885DRAFT_29021 [Pelagophyceae sp. CCMP2097]
MARALLGEGAPPASPGPCAVGSPAGSASDDDEAESCDTIMAESGSSLDDEPRARPPPRTPTRRASGGGASPRPEPPSPATPHTRAMSAPLGPCVRTHDYPSDFLAKWAEAAVSGAVADKLPPHAMPVGAQQVLAALAFVAGLPPRLRQVTAVPAWDGRRIIGYALLHAAPTSALFRRAADADAAEGPRPPPLTLPPTAVAEHGDDSPKTGRAWRSRGGAALVAAAPATPPRGAAPGSSLRRQSVDPLDCVAASLTLALADAGASRAAIDAALPDYAAQLPAELAEAARPAEAGRSERVQASRARRVLARRRAATAAARRAVSPAELALFDAGLRAPLEALVSTLYLASVKDQNPLHAIELLASAACQGRRTLLPWSGEWADPDVVGNGGEDDPCEKLAEEVGLDILEVAAAVHRGREFVEPVLELGLGSAGNTLFRTLSLFGAELVTQCSSAAERVDASSALRAHGGHAAVRKLSKLLAAARGADGRLAGVLPWSPGRGGRHGGPRATPASAAAAARAAAAADDAARDHDGDEDEDDELDDDELPRPDDGRADDDERYADDDDGRYADDRCYAEGRAAADDAACLRDAYVLRRGAGRARVRAADAPPLEAPCPEAPCADDEARCAYDEARDMEHSDGGPGAVPRDDGGEARGHHQRHRQRWRDGASAMPMMDDGEDDDDEEAAARRLRRRRRPQRRRAPGRSPRRPRRPRLCRGATRR